MKTILFALLQLISLCSVAQYIGVKARYTETRLVDNSPEPPSRENRLILSFFEVSPVGVYSPTSLSNYDLWVYKQGLQYGSFMGGVLDSTGNNYDGYLWPAPKAVAYYNTLGLNYIDCDPNVATHYVVNGHELDCGFIGVSSWEAGNESFTAPNICLPYYQWPSPYFMTPGNVNFSWPVFPTAPYNWYNFSCGASLQLVVRGVLASDTGGVVVTLPVRFANVSGDIDAADRVTISWSNMTESDILNYSIESSVDGISFQSAGTVLPVLNNGGRADYKFNTNQTATRVYYRIKAVENNGTNLYSNVFVLTRNISSPFTDESFSVYPNPVTNGQFTLRLTNAKEGRYLFSLVTPGGQAMKQKMIMHGGGDIVKPIDLTGVPPGMYTLILRSDALKVTKKIIITN